MNHVANAHASPHNSLKSYMTGFILSIILTAIPFAMVMTGSASKTVLISVVVISAVIQVLVHLICFLHLDVKAEGGWNMIAIIFAAIIIFIVVVGSLWIMWHLNHNMMPG